MESQPQSPAVKHETINSAIENMVTVTEHIQAIIDRIHGNEKTGETKIGAVDPPTASLCDILNGGRSCESEDGYPTQDIGSG